MPIPGTRAELVELMEKSYRASGASAGAAGEIALDAAVKLRPIELTDVPVLLDLEAALYAEDGDIVFEPELAAAAWRQLAADPSLGQAYLLDEAGEGIGYIVIVWGFSLEFHGRDAFVDELYIVSSRRGRGLGTAAMAAAERICRARGVRALHLEVEIANERAHALYRRLGYAEHGRRLMTRRLEP